MKKIIIKLSILTLAALAIAALPLHAADRPAKSDKPAKAEGAKKAARSLPFRGKLAAKTDSSITVGKRTFEVNAETKLVKDGKPATLADAVIGDEVGGSYWKRDDKLVARSIRFGPKPDAAKGGAKGENREKKSE